MEALNASGCSPVRLTPAVGVTTGAHYRMSTGHSSPALAHVVLISHWFERLLRGDPVKADQRRPRQGKTDADEVATAYPRLVVTEW